MNNTPQKQVKRIVSKGRYVQILGGKFFLVLLGSACSVLLGLLLVGLWLTLCPELRGMLLLPILLVLSLVTIAYGWGIYQAFCLVKAAIQLDIGVPLTRAHTADLPAPDSLVRAASEPARAQEAILLRPAANEQEWHKEQLLQATVEEEC